MSEIILELTNRGIITTKNNEMTIKLPEEKDKDFWEVETYDDNDNPIYTSKSTYELEEDGSGAYQWRIHPKLVDMKIIWVNESDKDINFGNEECFDSMEDAEEYFRGLNAEMLEQIQKELYYE